MKKRLFIVFILGFSSGLPLAMLSSTLQAWYAASGMSLLLTGSLSLIGIPYAYRFLWGPVVDRYSLCSLGKRRSWILCMQLSLLIGFNFMAWLNPEQHPQLLACLALALACLSATQDIAIDAHRTEFLPLREHALGATVAVFGYRLALLLSGGVALIIAQHHGWMFTYRLMGGLLIVGMIAILCSDEPIHNKSPSYSVKESFIAPLKDLCLRPRFGVLVLFILCFKLGEAFTTTTSGIVMPFLIQGVGFSLETIGYVNKILGVSALLAGGLIAGIILFRCSLYNALWCFGILQALTNLLFLALAMVGHNVPLLSLAVFADNFAAGMGSTALVALFMRIVNKDFTGTQFSILVALSTIPRTFSGPIAASIQSWIGWTGLYQLSVILACTFIPFLFLLRKELAYHPKLGDTPKDAACPLVK